MAHNVSLQRDVNGKLFGEAAYYKKSAWHGWGNVLTGERAPNSEEIGQASNIGNWDPCLEPVQLADGIPCEGYNAVVRSDTRKTIGMVQGRYHPFTNSDAFKFMDSLMADGIMRYEAAITLRGGSVIVLLARMPKIDYTQPGDTDGTARYVAMSTSHDGSREITIMGTAIRIECENMLRFALEKGGEAKFGIRHTASMAEKLETARYGISQLDAAFTLHADNQRLLLSRRATSDQRRQYVETLFPTPKDDASKVAKTKHENKMKALRASFDHPTNNVGSMRGTWWQALNMVTYCVDHDEFGKSKGSDDVSRAENGFLNRLEGVGADLKSKAFDLALAMSA